MYSKVKDHPDLVKDQRSGAILTVDNSANEEYIAKRNAIMQLKNTQVEINNIKEEINNLSQDMNEIKDLLRKMIK